MKQNKLLYLLSTFLILVSTYFINPITVFADKDPAVGTAAPYIEDAIKKGKTLIGNSTYVLGAGRNDSEYNASKPILDCSSFMHWMWNKGANINIVDDKTEHAGRTATSSMYTDLDVKEGQKISDLKRGDMMFFDTSSSSRHVGVYLGDNMFLHNGASTAVTIADITSSYWKPKFNGKVVTVKEGGKGIFPHDGADLSGEGSDKKEIKEEGRGTYVSPFIQRDTVINNTGVNIGEAPLGGDVGNMFTKQGENFYSVFIKIATWLSAVFFVYTSIGVIWYFTMLTRGEPGTSSETFEKVTGLSSDTQLKTKLNVLGRWVVSTSIVIIFLTGLYVPMMSFIYKSIHNIGLV